MAKIWLPLAVCLVLIAMTVVAQDWVMTFVFAVVLVVGVLISRRKARGTAAVVQATDTSWEKSLRRVISEVDAPNWYPLLVSGTCTRVPVFTGHSLSLSGHCSLTQVRP